MKTILSLSMLAFIMVACNPAESNTTTEKEKTATSESKETASANAGSGHYKGTFSNGMKGNKISFDVDGNELKNLTFEGYWHCEGKLDLTTLGPEKSFTIKGNKVDQAIIEPEGDWAPFHFDLKATINGNQASGTLRIANVKAGCDTYKLEWTAEKE